MPKSVRLMLGLGELNKMLSGLKRIGGVDFRYSVIGVLQHFSVRDELLSYFEVRKLHNDRSVLPTLELAQSVSPFYIPGLRYSVKFCAALFHY